jgi:hypothetical protein
MKSTEISQFKQTCSSMGIITHPPGAEIYNVGWSPQRNIIITLTTELTSGIFHAKVNSFIQMTKACSKFFSGKAVAKS